MPSVTVNTDTTARARAAALLPIVQETVPAADLPYVYNGAAGVGITRLASTMPNREIEAEDLDPVAGSGVLGTTFTLDAAKYTIAQVKATALGIDVEVFLSAALRTGLSLLAGIDPGPYTPQGISRQFLPPLAS